MFIDKHDGFAWIQEVQRIAASGSILVQNQQGKILLDINSDDMYVPASTLKIITSLCAIEIMGKTYRYQTELYEDNESNLLIKGLGDPILTSEELDILAIRVNASGKKSFKGIGIDVSFFESPLKIPGVSMTDNPYDALNSALCVNFNTISVLIQGKNVISGESQTPLTPIAYDLAKKSGKQGSVRINLSHQHSDVVQYSGEMIAAFLRKQGIIVGNAIHETVIPKSLIPFYVHQSSKTLEEIIQGMLHYSTNFIANQLFLTLGAIQKGPPASLKKSQETVSDFLKKQVGLNGFTIVEGSGISYENQLSARQLMKVLLDINARYPNLLYTKDNMQFKTGTLKHVKSIVGTFPSIQHERIYFVVLLKTQNVSKRDNIMMILKKNLS
ncbi:MAG: D-alanyl-D-alanine carboxypeptidase [Desulfobacterales bacterium]|nr:D-alanyl-D-alanine carboxypeptidase [Desulfobacterales bacterium]